MVIGLAESPLSKSQQYTVYIQIYNPITGNIKKISNFRLYGDVVKCFNSKEKVVVVYNDSQGNNTLFSYDIKNEEIKNIDFPFKIQNYMKYLLLDKNYIIQVVSSYVVITDLKNNKHYLINNPNISPNNSYTVLKNGDVLITGGREYFENMYTMNTERSKFAAILKVKD